MVVDNSSGDGKVLWRFFDVLMAILISISPFNATNIVE